MKKTHIMIISFAFLFVLGSVMVLASHGGNRVPTDGGDANNWGHILNTCLDNFMDASCNIDAAITDGTVVSADIAADTVDEIDLADDLDLPTNAEDLIIQVDADDNLLVTGIQSTDVTLAANRMAISGVGLVSEGLTADAFETTVAIADPTADNTITITADGGLISNGVATLGWTVIASGGAVCTTACVAPCVHGFDTAAGVEVPVTCASAASEWCLCAGAA